LHKLSRIYMRVSTAGVDRSLDQLASLRVPNVSKGVFL
jgi:hypothetical protein